MYGVFTGHTFGCVCVAMIAPVVLALAGLAASPHRYATAAAAHTHAFAQTACFRSALISGCTAGPESSACFLTSACKRHHTIWQGTMGVRQPLATRHGRAPSAIRSAFGGWPLKLLAAGVAANSGDAAAGEQRRATLQGLCRAQLQAVAKENGVPANKKSSEIIKLLLGPRPDNAVAGSRDEVGLGVHVTAPKLATALGGLGMIVIFPAQGEDEIKLAIACAQFGGDAHSITGTLSASDCVFLPPHSSDPASGEGGGGKSGRIAVMQRGGGLSIVAKALLAQGADHTASALIIANTDDTLFSPGDPLGEGSAVRIPVFLIAAKDAAALHVRHCMRVPCVHACVCPGVFMNTPSCQSTFPPLSVLPCTRFSRL